MSLPLPVTDREVIWWPVQASCGCFYGKKRVPLRISRTAAGALLAQLRALPHSVAALPLVSYRCTKCKSVVRLTVVDLLGGVPARPGA